MSTISKYGDPEQREPAAVYVKPLLRTVGGGTGGGSVVIDMGDAQVSHNAANGSPNYYLPRVDALHLRTDGLVDW